MSWTGQDESVSLGRVHMHILTSLTLLLMVSVSVPVTHTVFPFPGGETSALARLQSYFWETDNVAKYKDTRNGMIGSDYSTKFSPWYRNIIIS